jgi:cellulose synthase/poly-beta-1,6-N-acetylglucosamine synthase-like glycosyltransferase
MSVIAYLVFGIYVITLTYVTIYCVLQFHLLVQYVRKAHRIRKAQKLQLLSFKGQATPASVGGFTAMEELDHEYPFVTVQLPIFNEQYVIERLIDKVAAFDYPRDRFEIHILDDSTDETVDIVAQKVAEYKAQGLQIEQIQREKRQGFKAGALRDAMSRAQGAFIAIFDADFLPEADFLRRTIPYFQDEKVGVVQTRWAHINEDYSLLTRLQAVQLNVHFSVEQLGRMAGKHFLQFNGTAGVWRRETIDAAGGWEADTLTEDLDLSIRAQLKGWRIEYLEGVGSPAELPAEMNSLKSQQFRWMKGGAETAKKMLPIIWRAPISWSKKFHATYHLLASTIFLFVFLMGVFSVPVLFFLGETSLLRMDGEVFAYFLIGLLSIIGIYFVGNVVAPFNEGPWYKRIFKFVVLFPLFLSLSMGLSLHNSVAIIQGYRGKRSPFIRTPKFNIQSVQDSFANKKYIERKISWTTIFEGVLALYFGVAIIWALYYHQYTFIVYHFMLFLGFGFICFYTIRHARVQ